MREAGLNEVAEGMLTIRMDFASFEDFWRPAVGKDGPIADFVGTLDQSDRATLQEKVKLAYLDGDADGARSYAATAWAAKGKVRHS
jgi:hypothetical protein